MFSQNSLLQKQYFNDNITLLCILKLYLKFFSIGKKSTIVLIIESNYISRIETKQFMD